LTFSWITGIRKDPEELLGAALVSCYSTALAAALSSAGRPFERRVSAYQVGVSGEVVLDAAF